MSSRARSTCDARTPQGALPRSVFLLVVAVLAEGCATPELHLMASPVIAKDPRIDFVQHVPEERRSTRASVFYATTRAPVQPGMPGHYANTPGESVRLGVAEVGLGEPGWTFDDLVAAGRVSSVDNPRPGRVESIEELGVMNRGSFAADAKREFVSRVDASLAKLRNPVVVLYVPGYRVTFDEVAVMMGSLSAYLGQGVVGTFQWPTGQQFWNYLTDCPRAEAYVPDIEGMIALLSETKAQYVNLMAYSCGSPLLGQALARLRNRHPGESREQVARRYRIGNVIFAASDVDLKIFARDLVPPIMDLAKQTIVYVSRKDAALGFSWLVAGASRLGRPDIADLSVDELNRLGSDPRFEVIDITDVRGAHEMGGMRGHGYWYANEWIATDIVLSLRYPIPAEKRCLTRVGETRTVWRMSENYADCVAGRLLETYPELRRTLPP